MLDVQTFKNVVENTPLVSIDLCVVCDGQVLLGKRNNDPLKDEWDHFYNNSAVDQGISTHYVNLPHYVRFKSKPEITLDDQHAGFEWFDLSVVAGDKKFNQYMRNYASWLSKKMDNSYD